MALEKMSIMIDPELKARFIETVKKNYQGNLEEGIFDLMRVYVEKANGTPPQSEIRETIKNTVFEGDKGGGPASIELEKMLYNKTDQDIKDRML